MAVLKTSKGRRRHSSISYSDCKGKGSINSSALYWGPSVSGREWEGDGRAYLTSHLCLPSVAFFLAFLSLQMPDRCQFLLSLQTHGISATIFPILSTCHRFMCSCLVENEFKICALWSLTECGLYEILKLWPVWIFLWLFVLRFLLTFKQDWI